MNKDFYRTSVLEHGNRVYHLSRELEFSREEYQSYLDSPHLNHPINKVIVYRSIDPDFDASGRGRTDDEAIRELGRGLHYHYEDIALSPDEYLEPTAMEYKRKILALVTRVEGNV